MKSSHSMPVNIVLDHWNRVQLSLSSSSNYFPSRVYCWPSRSTLSEFVFIDGVLANKSIDVYVLNLNWRRHEQRHFGRFLCSHERTNPIDALVVRHRKRMFDRLNHRWRNAYSCWNFTRFSDLEDSDGKIDRCKWAKNDGDQCSRQNDRKHEQRDKHHRLASQGSISSWQNRVQCARSKVLSFCSLLSLSFSLFVLLRHRYQTVLNTNHYQCYAFSQNKQDDEGDLFKEKRKKRKAVTKKKKANVCVIRISVWCRISLVIC